VPTELAGLTVMMGPVSVKATQSCLVTLNLTKFKNNVHDVHNVHENRRARHAGGLNPETRDKHSTKTRSLDLVSLGDWYFRARFGAV
jgi:hypothetical protein